MKLNNSNEKHKHKSNLLNFTLPIDGATW